VNLTGAFICARAAARQMRRQVVDPLTGRRGAIILTSSPAAEGGTTSHPAYGPSKAGVSNLAKTAAAVLADDLISVTAFYPGNVWEGMQNQFERDLTEARGLPPGARARQKLEAWPSGRWQRPAQAAEIVAFIAARGGMDLNGQLVIRHPSIRPLLGNVTVGLALLDGSRPS
jgi:NAD(P)-dependent dehydrogenase (short-subunit alcohol dehydrogenase family)